MVKVLKRSAFLQELMPPAEMKKRMRVWSMYDAIASEAPELRVFEFHPAWRPKEQMAAYKDGSGNFFFAWFSPKGTVVRGFDHERRAEDPAFVFEGLPPSLAYVLKEPAFVQDELTFALWKPAPSSCSPASIATPRSGARRSTARRDTPRSTACCAKSPSPATS